MNFRPHLGKLVISGRKRVTRRLPKPDKPRSPWYLERCGYQAGRHYAVASYGKPAIGRTVVLDAGLERLGRLDDDEAYREGFDSVADFEAEFAEINRGKYNPNLRVWRVELRPAREWPVGPVNAPKDAFASNKALMWTLLARASWFTEDEARRLVDAAEATGHGDAWDRYIHEASAACFAANRRGDWDHILTVINHGLRTLRPPAAILRTPDGHEGPFAHGWYQAAQIAATTARAYLVADRPELSREGFGALTAAWNRTFA